MNTKAIVYFYPMMYKVIGLMSGSSLDGLDIACVHLSEVRGKWSFSFMHTDCVPYTEQWAHRLRHAPELRAGDFLKLHTEYGRYLATCINEFIARYELAHQVDFISVHGHTVFHDPARHTSFQLGDGATIAAVTGLPVIADLRAVDVALGGQGAPIVPVGDRLLFPDFQYLLNIGGIANLTIQAGQVPVACDVCAANQVLNALANREGKPMDEHGSMAAEGILLADVLDELEDDSWYKLPAPKSLSNEMAMNMVYPKLMDSSHATRDLLHTVVVLIAEQVATLVASSRLNQPEARMLVTGGGALNTFLMEQLAHALRGTGVEVVVPEANLVQFKEALVMALIGTLRWREESNVYSSVTGAVRDSVGGAIWLGA